MPYAELSDVRLRYELDGPQHAPVVMLSNSLGTTLALWESQVPALARHFRVLRYDTRGHGQSSVPPGPYSIAQLGSDVVGLLDHLALARVHFCGLSLGGMTGQWVGCNAPERLLSLTLANTTARPSAPANWDARIAAVNERGMEAIADAVLARWFTSGFLLGARETVAHARRMLTGTPAAGYVASCAAIRDMDQREAIARITTPTLVIAGAQDVAIPPSEGRFLADNIKAARYVELPVAHLSNLEAADDFTRALLQFLLRSKGPVMDERERYDQGMHVRRAVLGDAHVDRSLSKLTDFNREFQDLITRYAWGEVWTRPGLPRHTRSLLTVAMLIALNRGDEFRLHVRAAFNNGVTRDEIKEVILQAAIYAGVPAANSAFHMAEEVFAQLDAST